MGERADRIRLQVKVNPEIAGKVDELSGRMKMDRQDFLERLIEVALSDNEWVIRFVTSEFMDPVLGVLKTWKSRVKKGQRTSSEGA